MRTLDQLLLHYPQLILHFLEMSQYIIFSLFSHVVCYINLSPTILVFLIISQVISMYLISHVISG